MIYNGVLLILIKTSIINEYINAIQMIAQSCIENITWCLRSDYSIFNWSYTENSHNYILPLLPAMAIFIAGKYIYLTK